MGGTPPIHVAIGMFIATAFGSVKNGNGMFWTSDSLEPLRAQKLADPEIMIELEEALKRAQDRVSGKKEAKLFPDQEPWPEAWTLVQQLGRNTTFYIGGDAAAYEAMDRCSGEDLIAGKRPYPIDKNTYPGQLKDLQGSLWNNDEYMLQHYFFTRLFCGDLTRAKSPEEADLCFPVCGGEKDLWHVLKQRKLASEKEGVGNNLGGFDMENIGLTFEVPTGRRAMWRSCHTIGLYYEATDPRPDNNELGMWDRCKIMVPYLHGVAAMNLETLMPFDMHFERTSLLSYVGGVTQGRVRGSLLKEVKNFSQQAEEAARRNKSAEDIDATSYFNMPFTYPHNTGQFWHTKQMYKLAWETYAQSEFSWQPYGDTATRRAFYDAWMFGAIPVVTRASAKYYRHLFNQFLFQRLSEVGVVVPSNIVESGPRFMRYLMNIPREARQERRDAMRLMAPMLQWGWKSRGDALATALGVLRHEAMRASQAENLTTMSVSVPLAPDTKFVSESAGKDSDKDDLPAKLLRVAASLLEDAIEDESATPRGSHSMINVRATNITSESQHRSPETTANASSQVSFSEEGAKSPETIANASSQVSFSEEGTKSPKTIASASSQVSFSNEGAKSNAQPRRSSIWISCASVALAVALAALQRSSSTS